MSWVSRPSRDPCCSGALDIVETAYRRDHAEAATTLNNLAWVLRELVSRAPLEPCASR